MYKILEIRGLFLSLLNRQLRTARRETFYSPHKARSLNDYPKVEVFRDRGGE